jgi:hypothetical protein
LHKSAAKFLVTDWGGIVDLVWGCRTGPSDGCRSSRPSYILHRLAGRSDNPMPESTITPSQGLRIWDVGSIQILAQGKSRSSVVRLANDRLSAL